MDQNREQPEETVTQPDQPAQLASQPAGSAPQPAQPVGQQVNRKRVIIACVAALLLVALAVAGARLLFHGSKTTAGAIYGTMGTQVLPVPENMDDLTFGIIYVVDHPDGSGFGGGALEVKNGETVTLCEEESFVSATLYITRTISDSTWDVNVVPDPAATVYTKELPASLVWDMTDVLSGVEWTDNYLDGLDDVELTYVCEYSDSCVGQYYDTEIRAYSPQGKDTRHYWIYDAWIYVITK